MKTKLGYFVLLSSLLFTVASCGKKEESAQPSNEPSASPSVNPSDDASASEQFVVAYEKGDDEDIYDNAYGSYEALLADAHATLDNDLRFVKYAEAEAYMLDRAAWVPTTTNGGDRVMTRFAPRSTSYVEYGIDSYRRQKAVLANEMIKVEDRYALIEKWEAAIENGTFDYDPAAELVAKGYTLDNEINGFYSSDPNTFDVNSSSKTVDFQYTVNGIDGLVEFDRFGNIQPKLAQSWDISDDGLVYTFHLRNDAYWYTSEGTQYAKVTAQDFVTGFQHTADSGGAFYVVEGVIKNALEYEMEEVDIDEVGVEAVDDTTLKVTLEAPTPYFLTMLSYSLFLPINAAFFEAQGGALGMAEFAAAKQLDSYTYGTGIDNILYNSAYIISAYDKSSKIELTRNANYWDNANTRINKINYVFNDGSDPGAIYASFKNGGTDSITVTAQIENQVEEDGYMDDYVYLSDNDATTFMNFYNLNRSCYDDEFGGIVSNVTDDATKLATFYALQNIHFRRALSYAWDRVYWNGLAVGAETAAYNLRNIYTYPELCRLSADVEYTAVSGDEFSFEANTSYGDLVQAFLTDEFDSHIIVDDGQDGWYNPERAQEEMAIAMQELRDAGYVGANTPVTLEVLTYGQSESAVAQTNAYKENLERVLGANNVNIIAGTSANIYEYYYSGYLTDYGYQTDYDVFWGSGWGPDYGDPYTYLETLRFGGYMGHVNGLDA